MNSNIEIRNAGVHKGLGVFAKKHYEENMVIFDEKPLLAAQFCWNETYGYLSCHHCLRPMETTEENIKRLTNNKPLILPYPELCPTNKSLHRFCDICGIGFCSENCKQQAIEQYHKVLCAPERPALNKLKEVWKRIDCALTFVVFNKFIHRSFHYPPETTSIILLAKIIGFIEQAGDSDSAISMFFEFAHKCTNENEDMLMKFLGPDHSDNLKRIYLAIHEALPTTFVKNYVTEDGLKNLFALIGRNGQGIGTSVYSNWVKRVERLELSFDEKSKVDSFINHVYDAMNERKTLKLLDVGTFLNSEGCGLYKLQRVLNHSCIPNALVTFPYSNSTLSLITTREISEGEEICISYLDECTLERSRHSRRAVLRDYYLFNCHCEKCNQQADDPDVTSDSNEDDDDAIEDMEF